MSCGRVSPLIEMATINGARCAGLADSLGNVEVGKDADIALFDTTFPEWLPPSNPVEAIRLIDALPRAQRERIYERNARALIPSFGAS